MAVATAAILTAWAATGSISTSAASNYDRQFEDYPTYCGDDLELKVDNNGTHFRLWSPKAQEVTLNLYDTGLNGKAYKTLPMTFHAENGTWTASVPEKLYGKFYTFSVKQGGKWLGETPGVWAKAVGANGKRAAIIDLLTNILTFHTTTCHTLSLISIILPNSNVLAISNIYGIVRNFGRLKFDKKIVRMSGINNFSTQEF